MVTFYQPRPTKNREFKERYMKFIRDLRRDWGWVQTVMVLESILAMGFVTAQTNR